ncbi:hypothetical protein K5P26_02530 [Sphingopyxis sp. XHP0097]|uniref:Uncharacterized protein n=1 Tax=Sphingopyxis jiangsuensis TaxID=2871171 RepID=A0ABS7MAG7_9SPHN|nr:MULTISPECIES: hypothetical protein [Sphingopyxis]MBL0768269.1 hypothetical protein [Sphingopyxis lutea]MBY4636015.1 hypothetical protein [Sphingopyxis jiangsuensis]
MKKMIIATAGMSAFAIAALTVAAPSYGQGVETKQGVTSRSAGYRNGQPVKSDAELCANLRPATVGKVIPSTVTQCRCEDRNMGSRTRVCSVSYNYTVGVNRSSGNGGSVR